MLAAYIFIALFGSFIWVYYFKLIDVFEPEKWLWLILSFLIGVCSPVLVFLVQDFLNLITVSFEEDYLNIAYEAFFKVGLVEEGAKALAFLVSYLILHKTMNESIDYFIHICLCALGFSASENVLYFVNQGAHIIDFRLIMSSFGHIFDSSVFAYGIIYAAYKAERFKSFIIAGFFLLAVICHGFFDFLLMYDFTGNILLFFLYFMVTVSVFSVTLNNTLNHSEQFSYKKVIYPATIFSQMLICYFILLALKISVLTYQKTLLLALQSSYSAMLITLPLVLIIFQRISRFVLIRNFWIPIKLELPFVTATNYSDTGLSTKIIVRGHGQQEAVLGSYYGSKNLLCPVSQRNSWFDEIPEIMVNKKLFLEDYSIFYQLKFIEPNNDPKSYFIKAKVAGLTFVNEKYPIVALLASKKDGVDTRTLEGFDDFDFLCWCYLKQV